MLTLDLLNTSTYISDHAVYLNQRPVFTGMTNEFYLETVLHPNFYYFVVFKILKTIMHQKYIEFTESSTRNPQAKRWSRKIGSGSLTLVLAFILPT